MKRREVDRPAVSSFPILRLCAPKFASVYGESRASFRQIECVSVSKERFSSMYGFTRGRRGRRTRKKSRSLSEDTTTRSSRDNDVKLAAGCRYRRKVRVRHSLRQGPRRRSRREYTEMCTREISTARSVYARGAVGIAVSFSDPTAKCVAE